MAATSTMLARFRPGRMGSVTQGTCLYTVGGKGCFVGGEENAAEATCRRAEAELREALRQARLAGVEKTTAEALVERCYGGNE